MGRVGLFGICVCVGLSAAGAGADTLWLQSGKGNAVALDNVKIVSVQAEQITFTTPSGNQSTRPLKQVPRIRVDDEPAFSAAEEAFEKGDYASAADNYRKAIASSTRDWVKLRSSLRVLQAAEKSGNFPAAVAGYLDLLQSAPAAAGDYRPAIPKDKPDQIDQAIGQVKQASGNPQLKNEQKAALLNYLVEMYSAKGDTASAVATLQQLGQIDPAALNTPDARRAQAQLRLTQAQTALQQKNYAQAAQIIEKSGDLFSEPQQQADALYLLAEAREAAARPTDGNALKDAALAYMRVVANFKGVEGRPHVAEALLRTAAIEEKLKDTKAALALYRQVADEFKGSPAADQARKESARLAEASG